MELILSSKEHKISDNCLRHYFKNNTRFINQNILLTNMIFYNLFPNINENFKLTAKHNNRDLIVNFSKGAYNVDDISDIII